MKPKGRVLVPLCVLAIALLVPTGAAAGSGAIVGLGDRHAEAHLMGTHGFRITILASSGDLIVTARKGTAAVNYFLLKGGLEGDRIHSRLPGVGRVFLEFHDRHSNHRSTDSCRGPASPARKGFFVGTVKIRGERDYTEATSHHVRGEIVQEGRDKCRRQASARASSASSRLLSASTSRGKGRLSFFAFSFPSAKLHSDLVFGASLLRVRGKMVITTTQNALGKSPDALQIAAPPRSASVIPPAPFTGSASFLQEAEDQFSWTGDLAVELPGVGEVSLAGPNFDTSVCVGHKCRGDKDETESNSIIVQIIS
jgi:hypothetical protein